MGQLASGLSGGNATVSSTSIAASSADTTIAYDAPSATYTVKSGSEMASLGTADRGSDSSTGPVYSKTAGTISDTLALLGNVQSGSVAPPIALTYTSYGQWTHSDSASGRTAIRYLLFGRPTGASDMPKTGTASYQTIVSAYKLETGFVPSQMTNLSGTATFQANFGNGTVGTTLSIANGTFDGTGNISGDTFAGAFTSSVPTFVAGSFTGGFFGPSAKEMGYAFRITQHNSDPYAGAGPSAADTYISGVVLGVKN